MNDDTSSNMSKVSDYSITSYGWRYIVKRSYKDIISSETKNDNESKELLELKANIQKVTENKKVISNSSSKVQPSIQSEESADNEKQIKRSNAYIPKVNANIKGNPSKKHLKKNWNEQINYIKEQLLAEEERIKTFSDTFIKQFYDINLKKVTDYIFAYCKTLTKKGISEPRCNKMLDIYSQNSKIHFMFSQDYSEETKLINLFSLTLDALFYKNKEYENIINDNAATSKSFGNWIWYYYSQEYLVNICNIFKNVISKVIHSNDEEIENKTIKCYNVQNAVNLNKSTLCNSLYKTFKNCSNKYPKKVSVNLPSSYSTPLLQRYLDHVLSYRDSPWHIIHLLDFNDSKVKDAIKINCGAIEKTKEKIDETALNIKTLKFKASCEAQKRIVKFKRMRRKVGDFNRDIKMLMRNTRVFFVNTNEIILDFLED